MYAYTYYTRTTVYAVYASHYSPDGCNHFRSVEQKRSESCRRALELCLGFNVGRYLLIKYNNLILLTTLNCLTRDR